eukprot:IDg18044t1
MCQLSACATEEEALARVKGQGRAEARALRVAPSRPSRFESRRSESCRVALRRVASRRVASHHITSHHISNASIARRADRGAQIGWRRSRRPSHALCSAPPARCSRAHWLSAPPAAHARAVTCRTITRRCACRSRAQARASARKHAPRNVQSSSACGRPSRTRRPSRARPHRTHSAESACRNGRLPRSPTCAPHA